MHIRKTTLEILTAAVIASAVSLAFAEPSLSLADGLLWDPSPAITATGLDAGDEYVLETSVEDDAGIAWTAGATFRADPDGVIDTGRMAPVEGGYSGVDPTGLFWSMTPAEDVERFFADYLLSPLRYRVTLSRGDDVLASATATRARLPDGVSRETVDAPAAIGTVFRPEDPSASLGVAFFGGSTGGAYAPLAAAVAGSGYVTFVSAYFGVEGRPARLERIDLGAQLDALRWFADAEGLDSLVLVGTSRGAELALLLARTGDAPIEGVVAISPPAVVYAASTSSDAPAWRHEGEDVGPPTEAGYRRVTRDLRAAEAREEERVETIDALLEEDGAGYDLLLAEPPRVPVLLIAGTEDGLWPAYGALLLGERIDALSGESVRISTLPLPDAGHLIQLPNTPTDYTVRFPLAGGWTPLGGTPEGRAAGNRAALDALIAFLGSVAE